MKKCRFKIEDDGLARAWVSLRFKDKTALSKCLIDTGANVVAVSSALALTLNLPKLGKVTSGTAAGATQVMRIGQRKADELKLKGALAMLKSFVRAVEEEEWYVTVKDRETRIDQAIYRPAYETVVATLPKIQDVQLIHEAERVLEKANQCVEKV